jgi:nucleotide-binding universal stress UspA family protein
MTNTSQGIERQAQTIVVGVDGSKASLAALDWALRQARLTGAHLHAVTTWEFPTNYGWAIPLPDDMDFAADARTILDNAIDTAVAAAPGAEVEVTKSVIEGHAALVLAHVAEGASMLVVGSRGHGEFAGMLLGSVSEYLATHAPCPVLIIHEPKPAASA